MVVSGVLFSAKWKFLAGSWVSKVYQDFTSILPLSQFVILLVTFCEHTPVVPMSVGGTKCIVVFSLGLSLYLPHAKKSGNKILKCPECELCCENTFFKINSYDLKSENYLYI